MAKADLVLEGGGVKGLGLVGAVLELMRSGYEFTRVAGSSAGAVVGSLVAAGASAEQLAAAARRLDYRRVPDRAAPGIPGVSEGIGLLHRAGAHPGDYVREFVAGELARLGVVTFADLRRDDPGADPALAGDRAYGLVVTATDVTRGRLLRLPWDYRKLGLDPDDQLVADAVRASSSIPLYFEPVTLTDGDGVRHTLVDGGVLSNFPIELFDRTDGRAPRWPTLGVRVIPDLPEGGPDLFPQIIPPSLIPPLDLVQRVIATAIVGHDQTYAEQPCVARRVIRVDTSGVGIVEFGASRRRLKELVANGERAAAAFLATWDWNAFLADCGPGGARRPRSQDRR
jgi:NTE family protein